MIYDISPLIDERTAVWPGDEPYSYRQSLRLHDGDAVDLSDVRLSCHTGAHADAPSHFLASAPTIDEVALESYVGPCTLIDVRPASGIVHPTDLGSRKLERRVLFRTRDRADRTVFSEVFTHLSVELVHHLEAHQVQLLGLDTPSVDAFDSTDLSVHKALHEAGILNLESLDLTGVPCGNYELIALPLRLAGRDASPVRAVLRTL